MTCDLILNIRRCRRPVIAALNGTVAGAGAVIAAACDLRIAAESAKIAFLFVRVGLSGADMGASWLLPRLVGLGHATELLMTGDFIDARARPRDRALPPRGAATDAALAEAHGAGRAAGARPGRRRWRSPSGRSTLEADVDLERRAGPRGRGPGRADGASQLPRGLRGVPRQARAEVRRMMRLPDLAPIRAFLEHRARRRSPTRSATFAARELAPPARAAPTTPRRAARRARCSARSGSAGWLEPIRGRDWRACCLAREALAAASPLADAVFALQGLGALPILARRRRRDCAALGRRGDRGPRDGRLRDDRARGRLRRRRDRHHRARATATTTCSTAPRPSSRTPASPTSTPCSPRPIPAAGSQGASPASWCRPTRRACVSSRPQVLSAPHPLGEIAFEGCRVPAANRLGEEGRGFGARPRDARPPARHRGRGGLRHGGARARRGARARARAAPVRQAARRVPAGAGEARAHGDRADRGAAAGLPRGVGGRPRRRAGHARGGDGQVLRHRGGAADRRRRGADPRRARACWRRTRWTGSTARCARSASTRARPRSSTW